MYNLSYYNYLLGVLNPGATVIRETTTLEKGRSPTPATPMVMSTERPTIAAILNSDIITKGNFTNLRALKSLISQVLNEFFTHQLNSNQLSTNQIVDTVATAVLDAQSINAQDSNNTVQGKIFNIRVTRLRGKVQYKRMVLSGYQLQLTVWSVSYYT